MRSLAALILIGLAPAAAAVAQPSADVLTTEQILLGCRALIEDAPTADMLRIGACAGGVVTTIDIGQHVRRACVGVGVVEATRVVVSYADESAERRRMPFGQLALNALGDRWPCR